MNCERHDLPITNAFGCEECELEADRAALRARHAIDDQPAAHRAIAAVDDQPHTPRKP